MHKRNLSLAALGLAALISVSFYAWPGLGDYDALRWIYVPAILLTILFSGGVHGEISPLAGWLSFIGCTLVYWGILLVLLAIGSEFWLLRRGSGEIDSLDLGGAPPVRGADARALVAARAPDYLAAVGRALVKIEGGRRRNPLLEDMEMLDLKADPRLIAAQAIVRSEGHRAVKGVLAKLQARLEKEHGREAAERAIAQLRQDAADALKQKSAGAA